MKPIWAPFKIMQINISADLPVFFSLSWLSSLHSPYRQTEHFSRSLGSNERSPFCWSIKAEEKPGPGLIRVAHTGGMLCVDNWLSKQRGHRWILMVPPKCHLTDVTAAPILKRLVSKASIRAHFSPTVSGKDSAVCRGFYFRGTDLAFATLSAQDSAPTSRSVLNISNHWNISLCL